MSADIIDLDSRRREPHLSGPVRCLSCGHRWVAVAPAGTYALECPQCRTERGAWDWPVSAGSDARVFQCTIAGCESTHFKIVEQQKGVEFMCCKCGYAHSWDSPLAS